MSVSLTELDCITFIQYATRPTFNTGFSIVIHSPDSGQK